MIRKQHVLHTFLLNSLFLALIFISPGCDQEETGPTGPTVTLQQVVSQQASLSSFSAALQQTGIVNTISNPNLSFTIFAPNDGAFASYLQANGYSSLSQVPAEELKQLVNYHITLGTKVASQLDSARLINTLSDARVLVYNSNNSISLNGKATIVQSDLMAKNGVVHILDNVLTPPTQTLSELISSKAAAATNPQFTLLKAALQHTGLASVLNNSNQLYTVFAPTDAAFAEAGYATVEDITSEDPVVLQNILAYHLLPNYRFSFMLRDGEAVTRLGKRVTLNTANSSVKGIGNAEAAALLATEKDMLATNGVLHAIDMVLLPE